MIFIVLELDRLRALWLLIAFIALCVLYYRMKALVFDIILLVCDIDRIELPMAV